MIKTITLKESVTAQTLFSSILRRAKSFTLAILSLVLFAFSASQAQAGAFTVDNLNDDPANPTLSGTLRAAITAANAANDADTIRFTISSSGTINLLAPLPAITSTVEIGNFNSNGLIFGINGAATRNSTSPPSIGLDIQAPNCVINNLIITRFGEAGIRIGPAGSRTILYNNRIGTDGNSTSCPTAADPSVTEPCGNTSRGIFVQGASDVQIGQGAARPANVISGNFGRGISIASTTINGTVFNASATVRGNYIGTSQNGTVDLGNTQQGILIASASGSRIGGISAGDRNIISGNNGNGISIIGDASSPASNNIVRGNFIGVGGTTGGSDTGNAVLANNGSGIVILAAGNNTIGGAIAAARNVISGNTVNGVAIGSNLATGNNVFGNYIGVGSNGTTAIANGDNGIRISDLANGNNVGGVPAVGTCNAPCNIIANNGNANTLSARAGIYVDGSSGTGNRIRGNSIFGNLGIGIDLGILPPNSNPPTPATGTTANDPGDPDTGANNLQNFPVLNSANSNGEITGSLDSTANTTFLIDFYINNAADAMDSEGRTYIGSTTLDTGFGNTFTFNTGAPVTAEQLVTATATNNSPASSGFGDTSEFSANRAVAAATAAENQGFEADVAPRTTGDGTFTAADVTQVERFLAASDTFAPGSNEFQRADSAPVSTQGDGILNSGDVTQAQRYLANFETRQNAGGPTAPRGSQQQASAGSFADRKSSKNRTERNAPTAPREVRIENTNALRGQSVVIPVFVDAAGDESGYSFTLIYDDAVLVNPRMESTAAGGSPNFNFGNSGQISGGISFFGNPNGTRTIAPGNGQTLVSFRFDVMSTASFGASDLTFTDTPTARSISNMNGNTFSDARFVSGTVTIVQQPTAATVSVSGRVTAGRRGVAKARVVLTDGSGATRAATTNSFGYYRFIDVPAGETYTFNVQAKRYRFTPQVVNLSEDLNGFNFTPAP